MKKTIIVACIVCLTTTTYAHSLWVKAENKENISAYMIYGHDFPHPEKISKRRETLFKPIEVVGKNKTLVLSKDRENYSYKGKEKLKNGTYIVKATYKPTPWIERTDGKWEMNKTRKEANKEVKSCGIYSMNAKYILRVGESEDEFITKPFGESLEITPMVEASKIKKDTAVKFRVTSNGKRVKFLDIYGSFEGYAEDDMSKPFYAKTNIKGEFIFKPLKSGLWYLEANHVQKSGNEDCEKRGDKATLSFEVLN